MIYFFSLALIFNNQIFFTLSFLQCWLLLYALLWKKNNLVIIARFFPDLNLKKNQLKVVVWYYILAYCNLFYLSFNFSWIFDTIVFGR
jgi:hypothetical protein